MRRCGTPEGCRPRTRGLNGVEGAVSVVGSGPVLSTSLSPMAGVSRGRFPRRVPRGR